MILKLMMTVPTNNFYFNEVECKYSELCFISNTYISVIFSILVLTGDGLLLLLCVLVKTKTINHQGSHWLMITSQAVITTFILYNLSVTSVNHQTPSISVSVFILKCVLFLFLSISGTNRYIQIQKSKILLKKGYFLTTERRNWEDAEVSQNL